MIDLSSKEGQEAVSLVARSVSRWYNDCSSEIANKTAEELVSALAPCFGKSDELIYESIISHLERNGAPSESEHLLRVRSENGNKWIEICNANGYVKFMLPKEAADYRKSIYNGDMDLHKIWRAKDMIRLSEDLYVHVSYFVKIKVPYKLALWSL